MAGELNHRDPSGTAGLVVYAQVYSSSGAVWDGTALATYAAASWAGYAITLADRGGGNYQGDMPAAPAGAYGLRLFTRSGVAPAATDPLAGQGRIEWDGAAEVPLYPIRAVADRLATALELNAGSYRFTAAALANGAATVSDAGATAIADRILTRDWTLVAAPADRSMLNALRFMRNRWLKLGGVITVYAEDDATPAFTMTATTSAASAPIIGMAPR